ncbi:MAG TPA: hypothetical protein VGM23_06910, partial [Armatimonadota bacterium]
IDPVYDVPGKEHGALAPAGKDDGLHAREEIETGQYQILDPAKARAIGVEHRTVQYVRKKKHKPPPIYPSETRAGKTSSSGETGDVRW